MAFIFGAKARGFWKFFRAMTAFECPLGQCEFPRNSNPEQELCVIWLLQEAPNAAAVARVLDAHGFANFGLILKYLSNS